MLRGPAAVRAAFLILLLTSGLGAWTVTAIPKGPNQINLTWPAQPSPGYGYIVEVQSPDDSRYSVFTELRPIPKASGYTCDPSVNWHQAGTGCTISDPTGAYVYNPVVNGIPTWVTEPQYIDPQDGTAVQFIAAGLKKNSRYTFRVRTYKGNVTPSYGTYSNTVSATTDNYPVRYVSTKGNDANDGTAIDAAHAWRTIGAAGRAPCGTLVLVQGGDYEYEHIGLYQSCSPSSKVVIQSNYGEVARITSNARPDWGGVLTIYGDNVVIDGITIAENFQDGYVLTVEGSRNAFFNMDIGPTAIPSAYGGMTVHGRSNLVYGNYIHDFGSPYYLQNPNGAGGFPLALDFGASQNIIWSNHLTRGAHDCALIHNGSRNKFLNNISDGGWGMALETVYQGSQDNLFEGMIGVNMGALAYNMYKPAIELSYKSNTVRRSIFVNASKGIEISAYDDATNNLVYNNVFYNVARCYFQSHNYGVSAYDGVMVQNNICSYTYDATEIYLANSTPKAISYNNFAKIGGTGDETTVIWNLDGGQPYWNYVTLAYAEKNYGNGAWFQNAALSTAPASFVDPANMDFHLNSGSPLIGAGTQVIDPNWGVDFGPSVDLGAFGIKSSAASSDPSVPSSKTSLVLALSSSLTPSAAGEAVTFTATASADSATGGIQFLEGADVIGTATMAAGVGSLTTSSLAPGTHSISAVYSGDGNFDPSTSPAITHLVKGKTTTSLTASPNPAFSGQTVVLTATISASNATGVVQFLDGATVLATALVNNGTATLSISTLAAGSHSISAVYAGDSNFNGSTSAAVTQVVQASKTNTTTSITTSPNPSSSGEAVQVTATISASTATGTVQFLDGSSVIGSATVANGTASISTASLAGGTHTLTAVYSGNTDFNGSTSAAITQVVSVGKRNAMVAVNSSVNPLAAGQPVTFNASVSPAGATGSIQFKDGATVLGTVALSGGTANFRSAALTPGSHTITAVYTGDSNYNPASATLSQTVKASAEVSLSALNTSVPIGGSVQLTASISPASATGTVQFLDGATVLGVVPVNGGSASFSASALALGTHGITASYSGDSYNSGGVSRVMSVLVSKVTASVTLATSASPAPFGTAVTLTATVSPALATGSVNFFEGSVLLGSAILNGGAATLSVSDLAVGSHAITAVYGGDATVASATSNVLRQNISASHSGH